VTAVILHQYPASVFSEKVRICFGIKGLDWWCVDHPAIMPKAELTILTGGYRRLPVMQIGADVWCDSAAIVREIERRFAIPSLFPDSSEAGWKANRWGDAMLFAATVGFVCGGIADSIEPAFIADRTALLGRPFDVRLMQNNAAEFAKAFRAGLSDIERFLAGGQDFIDGSAPGLADAAAFQNLWLVRTAYPNGVDFIRISGIVEKWERRVKEIGHGRPVPFSRQAALNAARTSSLDIVDAVDANDAIGLRFKDHVVVAADDYGRDPVAGQLITLGRHEVAIRRFDRLCGHVVVHFPRQGYSVERA
jgi:glutathione S-transferase